MVDLHSELETLARDGFVIVEDLIDENRLGQAQEDAELLLEPTPILMPGVSGEVRGRMCKGLFGKSRAFDDLYVNPVVLALVREYLNQGDVGIKLSGCMIKDVQPREAHRHFHRDDDLLKVPRPHPPIVVNSLLALDDFTRETGATWVVPGSHKWDRPVDQDPDYEVIEMSAGSIVLLDGSVWHNNGNNLTHDRSRRALNMYYIHSSFDQMEGQRMGLNQDEWERLPVALQSIT